MQLEGRTEVLPNQHTQVLKGQQEHCPYLGSFYVLTSSMTTSNCPLGFLTGKNSLPFWPASDLWCCRHFTLRATWCTFPVHKYFNAGFFFLFGSTDKLLNRALHPDKKMSMFLDEQTFIAPNSISNTIQNYSPDFCSPAQTPFAIQKRFWISLKSVSF